MQAFFSRKIKHFLDVDLRLSSAFSVQSPLRQLAVLSAHAILSALTQRAISDTLNAAVLFYHLTVGIAAIGVLG